MAFGKFRDGANSLGRQAANWLQDDNNFSFRTRRRNGVVARKSGEFTNIYQKKAGLDGFYSLGAIVGGGTRIVGSRDGYVFSDRGPAPEFGGFDITQLGFYGKGLGSVIYSTGTGSYENFDGKFNPAFTYTLKRTYDGRTLKDYYNQAGFHPYGGKVGVVWFQRGAYWFNPATARHEFYGGIFGSVMIAKQQIQAYIRDDGNGNLTLTDTPYYIDQLGWYATPLSLAPGVMLKMDRYLRPHYDESSINVAECPGLYFTYSADAGTTWNPVGSTELFDAEFDSIAAIPTTVEDASLFNAAIEAANIISSPLSTRYSVCIARVPYVVTHPVSGERSLHVKVKMGLIDVAAGCTMMETAVLYDGIDDAASAYIRGTLAVPGGVLVFTRDVEAEGWEKAWKHPAKVRFTPDGTSLVDWSTMPFKENYTGIPSAYSPRVLVCPMWDGQYSLYESRDYGITWARAGLLCANGKPPNDAAVFPSDADFIMREFSVVTFLRKDDQPANATPSTPWLSDSRIAGPIL
jgi:hypothetical protein